MTSPRRGRTWARLAAVLVLVLVGLIAGTGSASAHAGLIGSDPADGVILSKAPTAMTLQFNEPVVVEQTSIVITEVGQDRSVKVEADPASASEASRVTFTLPTLDRGAYEVAWTTVSGADRHTSSGVVVFGVGIAPPPAPVTDPWPAVRDAIPRSLGLIGLTVAFGAIAVALLATFRLEPGHERGTVERRAAMVGAVGAGAALIGELGLLLTALGGASVAQLLTETSFGRRWLLSFGGTVAVAVVLVLAMRIRTRAMYSVAAAVAVATAAVQPLDTHLAAGGAPVIGAILAAVHLAAAGAWAGGLAVLVVLLALSWLRRSGPDQYAAIRRLFVGFAWLALPAAAVLAISGLLLTGHQVATVDALLFTHYGRILLLKVALVALIGLLGLRHAVHFRRPEPSQQRRRVPASVAVEAGVFVVVLVAAALLGGASPPRGAPWEVPAPPAVPVPVSQQVDDLSMTVSVGPGVVGPNVLAVLAFQTRRPSPGPVLLVTAVVTDGSGTATKLSLAPGGGEDRWRAALDLAEAGDYTVTVSAARAGLPDATMTTTWSVSNPPAVARAVQLSDAALPSLTRWLAFAFALAIAVAAAVALALRHNRKPPVTQ